MSTTTSWRIPVWRSIKESTRDEPKNSAVGPTGAVTGMGTAGHERIEMSGMGTNGHAEIHERTDTETPGTGIDHAGDNT